MNKKLFKRLLIASGLIAPVVMITPMILTSCNDNSTNNSSDGSLISLGNFNDLLKSRKKLNATSDKDKEFWLDVIGFHGNIFTPSFDVNDFEKTEVASFYKSIVNNKKDYVENQLIKLQGFQEINNTETIDYSKEIKLVKNNEKYAKFPGNLDKVFKGLYLSNVFDETNINDNGVGLTMKWDNVNFEKFLKQVDTKCEISIIDIPSSDQNNTINNSKFTIKYTFTPKDDNKWAGVKSGEEKYPLVVTLNDYIDNVSITNDLVSKEPNKKTGSTTELEKYVYEKKDIKLTLTTDSNTGLKTEISKLLGVKDSELTTTIVEGTQSTWKDLDSDTFYETDGRFKFIDYLNDQIKSTDGNTIINKQSFIDALINKRISAQIINFTNDTATPYTSTVKIRVSLLSGTNNIPNFKWFLDFKDFNDGRNIIPIDFELTFTKA